MSDYYNILTNLGRSKITDLITSDAALENIQIAFGDGNGSVPTPNPARTALVNEVHRRPANKLQKHPTLTNSIIVDVVIPNNVGGFWIREFGIYFDGVLICNGSLAPTFKEASDDTVNTYRLKPYINVESDRLKVVEVEGDLINATESWTQENFINRSEIVDNLTTDDATKIASAKQVKILQDNKLEATDLNDASTTQKGVVKLVNDLTTGGNSEALTAEMGKKLSARFVDEFLSLKSENGYQKLPGGLIIQWGAIDYTAFPGEPLVSITFPIAFPNACLNFSTTRKMSMHDAAGDGASHLVSTTKTGAEVSLQNISANTGYLRGCTWFSIGY